MAYFITQPGATVTAHDYEHLLAAYEHFKSARELIARFVVTETLSEAQIRSLPSPLRKRLVFSDASVESLERLASLPDPRD